MSALEFFLVFCFFSGDFSVFSSSSNELITLFIVSFRSSGLDVDVWLNICSSFIGEMVISSTSSSAGKCGGKRTQKQIRCNIECKYNYTASTLAYSSIDH